MDNRRIAFVSFLIGQFVDCVTPGGERDIFLGFWVFRLFANLSMLHLRVTFCKTDTHEIKDPSISLIFGTCVYHDKKCISSEFQRPCSFTL